MNRGMTVYDHHDEAYHVCRAHREEDCEICFGEEEVSRDCTCCGLEIDDGEAHKTNKGLMCRSCYIDYLEGEVKSLRLTKEIILSFIQKEADTLEKVLSTFIDNPSDPHRIGLMVARAQTEANTMKFYVERQAV